MSNIKKQKEDILGFELHTEDEFEEMFEELAALSSEFSSLEKINSFTKSISAKLSQLYNEKFPKKCNCCGKVFNTRDDYLKATQQLSAGGSGTVFNDLGLQEYRNCPCGSTLLIVTDDRRDTSDFGKARRKLFHLIVERLILVTDKEEDELRAVVRKIFRRIMKRNQIIQKSKAK
jgi:DNA-directed RNA polymerase subunit N (RpoN/RPB10)